SRSLGGSECRIVKHKASLPLQSIVYNGRWEDDLVQGLEVNIPTGICSQVPCRRRSGGKNQSVMCLCSFGVLSLKNVVLAARETRCMPPRERHVHGVECISPFGGGLGESDRPPVPIDDDP